MAPSKKKEKITKSTLSYSRIWGNTSPAFPSSQTESSIFSNIPGYSAYDIENEAAKRTRLYAALKIAEQNKDAVLIAKIKQELGQDQNKALEEEKLKAWNKQLDESIQAITQALVNPDLDDEQHDRLTRTLQSFILARSGNQSNPMLGNLLSMPRKKSEPEKGKYDNLVEQLITNLLAKKNEENQKSDFDKFMDYQKLIGENTPSLIEQLTEAKEIMKLTGQDQGGKTLDELKLMLESKKLDKEFDYKFKELETQAQHNKVVGSWVKDLSTAVVESVVDSLEESDDEEEDEDEKQQQKQTKKNKKKGTRELKVKCFNCKKLIEIESPEESREIVCPNCSWPHYFEAEGRQVKTITPDSVRMELNLDPKEWLDDYEPGDIIKILEDIQSNKEQDNDKEN